MKKNTLIAFIAFVFGFNSVFPQENFKIMFYNMLNFPIQEPANTRLQYLDVILNDYRPDLLMVCELNNESGANSILGIIKQGINPDFEMATFVTNSSDDLSGDENELQNLIYFDSSKFILVSQEIIPTTIRDFNLYTLKLNTIDQDSNPIYLYAIVGHLKSSSGTDNQQLRLEMVQALTQYLNNLNLPQNSYVMLGGDLNLYTNSENAFEELLNVNMDSDAYPLPDPDPDRISFVDPANRIGSWSNNTSYLDVFTQSTRTTGSGLGGAGGGFDDRFDFILTSQNMLSNSELYYVPNSYKVYGNNNNPNCYNESINSINCSGSEYSAVIREALYNFSDHLPVTLQLETDKTLLGISETEVRKANIRIVGTNIVGDILKLYVDYKIVKAKELYVYNNIGQLINRVKLKQSSNLEINVSALPSGIYYIAVPIMNVEPIKFAKTN